MNLAWSFVVCFFFWTAETFASSEAILNTEENQIWVSENPKETRYFLELEDDNGYYIKYYSQKKGEYQTLIESVSFKSRKDALNFIKKNFASFKKVNQLPFWDVVLIDDRAPNKQLWEAKNTWNHYWEDEYAKWMATAIDDQFFMRYNVATDCADALIGFRWIFSRINSLPVANTLASTGNIFGHFSMLSQWRNLPTSSTWYEDKLFMTALNYVMELTSTRTILASDAFPVSITKNSLKGGTFIMTRSNGSGHIRTITQSNYANPNELPFYTTASTSPREVRALYREAFVDQAWPSRGVRDVLAFKWPIQDRNNRWYLNSSANDERYSTEQYNTDLPGRYYSFIQYIIERTKESYNPLSLIETGVNDLVNYTHVRIKIVEDGYNFCKRFSCRYDSKNYDDWSTPNRDAKFAIKFTELETLITGLDPIYQGILLNWKQALDTTYITIENTPMNLARLRYLFENKLVSSNPNDSIEKRWGL